jgi:hypothetical protein
MLSFMKRGSPADMQLQTHMDSDRNPDFKALDKSTGGREITVLRQEGSLDSLKNIS